jgi:hypothetical protein
VTAFIGQFPLIFFAARRTIAGVKACRKRRPVERLFVGWSLCGAAQQ